MKEHFIFFIWAHRLYDNTRLLCNKHKEISIIHPGYLNDNAGPDFSEAQIKYNGVTWNGNIEIHTKSSDWNLHKHSENIAYHNIVLHVVYEDDLSICLLEEKNIPTLVLGPLIPKKVHLNIHKLMTSHTSPSCANLSKGVSPIVIHNTLEKACFDRLSNKSQQILSRLKNLNGNWGQVAFELSLRAFGFGLNSDVFELMARKTPYHILLKNSFDRLRVSSLIFGQAAVRWSTDDYSIRNKTEYNFLRQKYGLSPIKSGSLKFMRTRPYNFPTIRLAQFSALIGSNQDIVSWIDQPLLAKNWLKARDLQVDTYWNTHTDFGKPSVKNYSQLSPASINLLYINIILPLQFAFGVKNGQQSLIEHALSELENLPAEKNKVSRMFKQSGFPINNALQSQGALHHNKTKCSIKQCGTCPIAHKIIC